MSEDNDPHVEKEYYPIISVDGAYHKYLDGFVSLLFYQIITMPDHDRSKVTFHTERQTVADLRIPINTLKKFLKQLQDGLDYYPIHGLVNENINYVVGDLNESNDELNKTLDIEDDVERNLVRSISEAQSNLSPEGKKKFGELFKRVVGLHVDEFREVIRQDEEIHKVSSNE